MGINKGKHIVEEIDGVRCSVVEATITESRMKFLKELLECNNYIVKVRKDTKEDGSISYTIGVTDILFNAVIAVYERRLKTKEGKRLTADYWNQKTTEINPFYWKL